jgi:hypothetical protein
MGGLARPSRTAPVKIAAISDVRGNLRALQAVLDDIADVCADIIFNCGDTLGLHRNHQGVGVSGYAVAGGRKRFGACKVAQKCYTYGIGKFGKRL